MKNGKSSSTTVQMQTGSETLKQPFPQAGSKNGLTPLSSLKAGDRKVEALRRFLKHSELTVSEVQQAPPLPFPENRKSVIAAMRYSEHSEVKKFLKVYDAAPTYDRQLLPASAIALKANCDVPALLGAIVLCFRDYQAQKSALRLMAAHPKVLDSTILYAGMPGGERDRRMVH